MNGFLGIKAIPLGGKRISLEDCPVESNRPVFAALKKRNGGIGRGDPDPVTFGFCEKHFGQAEERAGVAGGFDLAGNAGHAIWVGKKFDMNCRGCDFGGLG